MGRPREFGKTIANHLPPTVKAAIQHAANPGFRTTNPRYSFSQEGEDLLIDRMFDGQSVGFYVDVGAHHPTRFSNTYLLYLRGWRGINIDATQVPWHRSIEFVLGTSILSWLLQALLVLSHCMSSQNLP